MILKKVHYLEDEILFAVPRLVSFELIEETTTDWKATMTHLYMELSLPKSIGLPSMLPIYN